MLHNFYRTEHMRKGIKAQGRNGSKAQRHKRATAKTRLEDTYKHLSHTEQIPFFYTFHLPQLSMAWK